MQTGTRFSIGLLFPGSLLVYREDHCVIEGAEDQPFGPIRMYPDREKDRSV